ncbi:unnamed protein product, partial [Trichogramma brassicae]
MPCRCLLVDVGEVRSESTEIGSTPLLARRSSLVDGWWIGAGFVRRVCCSMTCGSAPLLGRQRTSLAVSWVGAVSRWSISRSSILARLVLTMFLRHSQLRDSLLHRCTRHYG